MRPMKIISYRRAQECRFYYFPHALVFVFANYFQKAFPSFILYEYAIRLEMKDAFFGCHESYRFPFPPFVLHLSPVLQDAGFSGFSGLLGFEKKKKKKSVLH